jgi:hypothetical protein
MPYSSVQRLHADCTGIQLAAATQYGTIWLPPVASFQQIEGHVNFRLMRVTALQSVHLLNVFGVDHDHFQLVKFQIPGQMEWIPHEVYELDGTLPQFKRRLVPC